MRSHLLSSIAALSGLVPQLALRQGLALPALGSARSFAKAADSGAWANLPREVRIVEVGPRDGLQNEPKRVETAQKLELVRRLVESGLNTVEATAFVSPKWVPQMSDHKEINRFWICGDRIAFIHFKSKRARRKLRSPRGASEESAAVDDEGVPATSERRRLAVPPGCTAVTEARSRTTFTPGTTTRKMTLRQA